MAVVGFGRRALSIIFQEFAWRTAEMSQPGIGAGVGLDQRRHQVAVPVGVAEAQGVAQLVLGDLLDGAGMDGGRARRRRRSRP